MAKKQSYKSYDEALEELQQLVAQIEDPNKKLDALSDELKRATELIKYCKECLKTNSEELLKILED